MSEPRATARRLGNGWTELRFPFSWPMVHALKASVPPSDREWDAAAKVWRVSPAFRDVALDVLTGHFPDAHVVDADQEPPSPIRTLDADFAELHLLPSAPPCVVEAVYKVLAKEFHPDRKAVHERAAAHEWMCRLNAAMVRLREAAVS